MIFLNNINISKREEKIVSKIFDELNTMFPGEVKIDFSFDNIFLNSVSSSNNFYVFFNSVNFKNNASCWKQLDEAFKLKSENKIQKIIEIKLDNEESPNFIRSGLIWKKYQGNELNITNYLFKGIKNNNWIEFDRETNLIYVKAFYKNNLENSEAILVNEKDDWDVVMVKIKAMHDNIISWNYSVVADQTWLKNFFATKPKISLIEEEELPSELWLLSKDVFHKTISPNQNIIIDCNQWQAFLFFRETYEAYGIKRITLTIRDHDMNLNYTIDIV